MDPQLVIFAIESAIKLGIKINEVLLDETNARALVLPLGRLAGDVAIGDAGDYFHRHPELLAPGGIYAGLAGEERVAAYKAMVAINQKLGEPDDGPKAADIVKQLQAFEQFGKGFGPNNPVQRILGTVVEIGIDYFAANPKAMGNDSAAKRIVSAFLLRLEDVDFTEGSTTVIVGRVLTAALQTLDEDFTLIDDDQRLQAMLHGVTNAFVNELAAVQGEQDAGKLVSRRNLIERLGSSALRGAAGAFTENIDLFIPKDGKAKKLVESALTQVMDGVEGKENLFTNESLELIFRSGLRAVGENAAVFSDEKVLQALITSTTAALTDDNGRRLFSEQTVAAVVAGALAAAGDNLETLIDPHHPQQQLLAHAVSAMAHGLSSELGADPSLKNLLSQRQLVDLTQIVFGEVARDPEALLGGTGGDPRKTALAQVIGSVAAALGADPSRFVDGQGLRDVVETALGAALQNASGLIDLQSSDPKTNQLFRVLSQVATAIRTTDDPRRLVSRQGFVDLVSSVLPVVSANVDPLLAGQDPKVQQVIATALQLANGTLGGRIDGANFAALVRGLLLSVAWDGLDLTNQNKTKEAATQILRAAA
jgi:hypothetical protein